MEESQQISSSDNLINKAKESEINGTASFMEPNVKEKKKKGRPRKDQTQDKDPVSPKKEESQKSSSQPQFNIPTKILCVPIVRGISAFGVNYTKNAKAAMQADEIEGMSEAMGMVLDKYLPDAMNKYGPEIVLGVSLSQYGLRLYALKKVMEHDARVQEQKSQTSPMRPTETTTGMDNLVQPLADMSL